MTLNRMGGLASFILAVSFIVAPLIYLMGNLRNTAGVLAYQAADWLYGPVLSISLIVLIHIVREQIGQAASRRMDLSFAAAVLSAAGMAAVAFIRASNRQYHLAHPELHLEDSATVLLIWTTLVAGFNGLGFHFMGWTFILLGTASWSAGFFPPALSVLQALTGVAALFVYLLPELEGLALMLGTISCLWQAAFLWTLDGDGKIQQEKPA